MSTLKPGWADTLGKQLAAVELEPSEWAGWRAKGYRPFRRTDAQMRDSARRGGIRGAEAKAALAKGHEE